MKKVIVCIVAIVAVIGGAALFIVKKISDKEEV